MNIESEELFGLCQLSKLISRSYDLVSCRWSFWAYGERLLFNAKTNTQRGAYMLKWGTKMQNVGTYNYWNYTYTA